MRTFVIGEIGINHNGDINIAKKLIKKAAIYGADAVKFQKRDIDLVYTTTELNAYRESPWGKTNRDQKLGLEFKYEDYKIIDEVCKKNKIEWFASAWDKKSIEFLNQFDLKYTKVPSALIVNQKYLEAVAKNKKYTFISTGMCTLNDIENCVKIFKKNNCNFELMHCISAYPFEDEKANLKMINFLSKKFDCKVGYSGHEKGGLTTSLAAVAIGATSLERHITIDRTMYGSDQSASLTMEGFRDLVESVRKIEKALVFENKSLLDIEKPVAEKLRKNISNII